MKLKTLNDLNGWGYGIPIEDGGFFTDSFFVDSHKLKQEAIKWVKECRETFGKNATGDFWMEKLNISEEEVQ